MSIRNMSVGVMQNSSPVWAGSMLDRDALLPGGGRLDSTLFAAYPGPVTVTTTADAAVNAVTIAVAALSAAIPANTPLTFGIPGLFAVTDRAHAASATTLNVFPLQQAILSGAVAIYPGSTLIQVPSGTLVSRTFAQRAAGNPFHPAINTDEEFFLVAYDVPNAAVNDECALVLPTKEFVVKENYLPGWATLAANLKAIVRANWTSTIGSE